MSELVTIAGGGLAGLSLGVALRVAGLPVQLHEAGAYPRHRVCGEFICGVNDQTLQGLAITKLFEGSVTCQSSTWFYRGYPVYKNILPMRAIGISRYLLDERLAERFVELGGDLQEHSRIGNDALDEEGTVCAAGRKASGNDWLGLKFHLHDMPLESDLELHLGRGGYLGLSKVEDGVVNVCGLFRRQMTVSAPKNNLPFAYMENSDLAYLLERFSKAKLDESSISGVSGMSYRSVNASTASRFSIGDHAGLIPPFTGNGMSIAFESAVLALDSIKAWASGGVSWQEAKQNNLLNQNRAFAGRKRVARFLHPLILQPQAQQALSIIARSRLLPFNTLFKLTH